MNEKVVWFCATYVYRGSNFCSAKRISEDILRQKCVEVLGISEYEAVLIRKNVKQISVPEDGVLIFALADGCECTVFWENRSRRESWTDEMKTLASEKTKGRYSNA